MSEFFIVADLRWGPFAAVARGGGPPAGSSGVLSLSPSEPAGAADRVRIVRARVIIAVLAAILLAGRPMSAQRYASLAGHVLDTSGGGIAGAVVTVTNQDTGFRRSAESETGGAYAVVPLEAG